jgi:hypothetical protein
LISDLFHIGTMYKTKHRQNPAALTVGRRFGSVLNILTERAAGSRSGPRLTAAWALAGPPVRPGAGVCIKMER